MEFLSLLTDPHAWIALVTLTALEIVLGIDNLVFLAVLTSRLDGEQARRARMIGLSLAFVFRVVMLAGLTWLMELTNPIVTLFGMGISWRDIILIGGGMFLIAKATARNFTTRSRRASLRRRCAEILRHQGFFLGWSSASVVVIDMVFSLDSIITAIGMAQDLQIMIAAVVIA